VYSSSFRLEVIEDSSFLEKAGGASPPRRRRRGVIVCRRFPQIISNRSFTSPARGWRYRNGVNAPCPRCTTRTRSGARDPVQLADDDAQVFGALGDLDLRQLLHRPRPAQLQFIAAGSRAGR